MSDATLSAQALLVDEVWRSWSPERKRHLLERVQQEAARRRQAAREPYPWQRPHEHPDGWQLGPHGVCTTACNELPLLELKSHETYALIGGRGIGKTDAGSMYVLDHVNGPACDRRARGGHRPAIVAPTLGDAVESCVNGISGLAAYDPRVKAVSSAGGTFVRFPNGVTGKLFGASTPADVERLRAGGNRCIVWLEEAAAMRYLDKVLEHTRLGLRVGPRPHYVATTTPRTVPAIRSMLTDRRVHITRGRTEDAHHLDASVREALYELYAGSRLGRQELEGLLLDEVEGALWKQALIDRSRIAVLGDVRLARIVVGVDPNGGGADDVGIVVVGISRDKYEDSLGRLVPHLYVLEDASGAYGSPGAWARRVAQAYHRWDANAVIAETNYGGDMVPYTIATVDPSVRCEVVTATRGKRLRAEPVVALYERDSVHHVGVFPKLEDQQSTWTESDGYSPDRIDALVWAATKLGVKTGGGSVSVA